ncbi:MAG: hypothetical protein JXJ17_14120 [Anaerolineae bacterium]|nr:hypothetical protein [Anaerolineae bacterium]
MTDKPVQAPPRSDNPDVIELIYQNELAARDEILTDWHNVKRGSQLNLTTSAVLLGLLLNLGQVEASSSWSLVVIIPLAISASLLLVSSAISLQLQFTSSQPTGFLRSEILLKKYDFPQPKDLRLKQINNLVKVRIEFLKTLKRVGDTANIGRIIIVASILCIGFALIYDLFTRVI